MNIIPKLPAQTEPFIWGVVVGAVALAIVGFTWGGWMTSSKADTLAGARADEAILSSLVPICVAQFKKGPEAQGRLAALKEVKSWDQAGYVTSGGWATMPGSNSEPSRQVAAACAEELNKLVL